jgi:uncharacterized phage protein (TIGR01671 family)
MREILFRGKDKWGIKGWLTGDVSFDWLYDLTGKRINNVPFLAHIDNDIVDIETLGQFSGVKDKNDVPMFEGDIVDVLIGTAKKHPEPVGYKAVVDFKDGAFGLKYFRGVVEEFTPFASYYKPNVTLAIIGNIHDNPELMEV